MQPSSLELWFTEKEFDFKNVGLTLRVKRQIHSEETPFQRLDIFETFHYGKMMTLDGIIQLTEVDEHFYHEQLVHVPLFMHPDPKRVLVVGGGDGGTAREVLRHPGVEQCEMAEIDEKVILAARQWFPTLAVAFEDKRLTVHVADAIKFIADARPGTYDAILVDSSDPVGPAVGLFRKDFYENCKKALKPQGLLVCQTGSFWYQPNESKNACLLLREVFGAKQSTIYWGYVPTYPSASMAYTIAAQGIDLFDFDKVRKPEGKSFETLKHYTAANHRGHFCLPKVIADGIGQP
ncbi:MAG: polyamine aminopropyltransferase [Planctomycetota bacterium]